MNEIIRKLTSRKLWLALAGVATGIFLALGGESSEVHSLSGADGSGNHNRPVYHRSVHMHRGPHRRGGGKKGSSKNGGG